jgi:glucuronokinase
MIVRKQAYARVGLAGNPSDGYHGKTVAFTISDFSAEVTLYESPELELRTGPQDLAIFDSVQDLLENVRRTGYYGGVRLLKAATKKFAEYCAAEGYALPSHNFTVLYSTNIPRQVGLGGSSAIITAVMRALMEFFEVHIPDPVLPNVVLSAESDELGLTAGLQDRVVQAYGGLVYMDFDRAYMDEHGFGRYERLDAGLLPPVYIAYRHDLGKESSTAHIKVRDLYELGDAHVVQTMGEIASLADAARDAIERGDQKGLAAVINRNFDLRRSIFDIRPADMQMIETARKAGASSSFCGSGGAVVGTAPGQAGLERVRREMEAAGYAFVVPHVVNGHRLTPDDD